MTQFTRRRFLGGTLAAAASLSAFPRIAKARNVNDKMGVAVVGVGGRGGGHVNEFLDKKSEAIILYIVDSDENTGQRQLQRIAGKQEIEAKYVRDMRDAFRDPDVDVISTATPNHWHALCGVWAMQHKKHAYIEKPVSHEIAEGSALVAAARKYDRICQVGTQCRASKALRDAVEFMRNKGIGELRFARGLCYKRRASIGPRGDYPIPNGVDFNLWSGPAPYTEPKITRPKFHYDWHWQRLYGNGDSGNQGPHQTDIARWGLGIDTHPISVITYGGRLGYQAERNDPEYADAGDTPNTEVSIFDYVDKCIVFETRGLAVGDSSDKEINLLFRDPKNDAPPQGNVVGVIFYGSEGYLVQRTYSHCVAYDKQMKVIKEFSGGGDHLGNFLEACQSGNRETLFAEVREGHLSAAMAHLGNISYYLGEQHKASAKEIKEALAGVKSLDDNEATVDRTVQHLVDNGVDMEKYSMSLGPLLKFDPDKEVFPDSPEATAMVTREYRDEFVCPTADKV
ncbi:MAG: Gfo/Idh/MocA family oxidoreductase [Planctomycetes bacterium]|nr:Gfo/Idh/MocA family oxidoreductase [Planctomycetota bacterium]